ncbi:RdRP-domain-containing protein [Phlebopus sp. FC_14]|nr:RdRP-domain-containing protein [Phlebopus sp. FC_14]
MDLFMREIALAANEDDVKLELAKILHKPPFPHEPLNFEVRLFRKNNARGRIGILTLPTTDAGNTFLRAYGTTGVFVKGRRIIFTLSNRPVTGATVARLNETTWRDPRELEAERERLIQASRPFELADFAFGRFLGGDSFIAEYSVRGRAHIACDLEDRRVRLTLHNEPRHNDDFVAMFGLMDLEQETSISASYSPSNLDAIVSNSDDNHAVVFLRAQTFPVFLSQGTRGDRTVSRRLQGLVSGIPMPPGCFSLECTFQNKTDRDAFIHTCQKRLSVRHIRKSQMSVRREHSSPVAVMEELNAFLAEMPFELAFEIDKAVANWTLTASTVLSLKHTLIELQRTQGDQTAPIFRKFISFLEGENIPRRRRSRRNTQPALCSLEQQLVIAVNEYLLEQQQPRRRLAAPLANTGVSYSYHMVLTPTRHILEGPVADQSNSVLRRFGHHECFLRVTFQDEDRSKLRREVDTSISELLSTRYRPVLLKGCVVAGRKYRLLGYSMSGLKEHSMWFVTPFENDEGRMMDAQTIRESLGDFSPLQYQPARLGARWSQAFSATDPSITLQPNEICKIQDRKSASGKIMTDGCSPISAELADDIWRAHQGRKRRPVGGEAPSAIQYRLGGAKGMVVQDPNRSGKVICLRPSQVKFDAPDNRTFDIQSTSLRPKSMFLNRPLIVLMEYLGVSSKRIIELQDDSIHAAQSVQTSFLDASTVLQQHGLGASFHLPSLFRNIADILHLPVGNDLEGGSFYNDLILKGLHCAETHILRELKYRAHIGVPDSFTLLGVSDEWDCLREGEIYATVYDERKGLYKEITGRVAITRSPQIHPGDLQVVTAVRRPELEHLTNVVVFSCRGDRSLASCLGGGDLDGDDFNLILDPNLLPQIVAEPGEYKSLPIKQTLHPCGIEDVVDFIFDYIEADLVGHIAISHLRFSDLKDPSCQECLQLAEFASHAVDFPKTGTPVKFEQLPRHRDRTRPDFLAREGSDPNGPNFYNSKKLLGILCRRVPVREWIPDEWRGEHSPSGGDVVEQALESVGLYALGLGLQRPSDELCEEMNYLLDEYCEQLLTIASAHTISKNKDVHVSEAELLSGTIMANWSDHHRRREAVTSMNLQTHELVRAVRAEFRPGDENHSIVDDDDFSDDDWYEDEEDDFHRESRVVTETFKRAWAAWCVAEKALADYPESYGPQSFGLVALGRMLELIKAARQLL